MKLKIQYSVTILGEMELPNDCNLEDKEVKALIENDYWNYEPNDIEWEVI